VITLHLFVLLMGIKILISRRWKIFKLTFRNKYAVSSNCKWFYIQKKKLTLTKSSLYVKCKMA